MIRIGLCAVFGLVGFGCGGRQQTAVQPEARCIDQATSEELLARMFEASKARLPKGSELRILSKTCHIERYQRGPLRYVIYKEPSANTDDLDGSVVPIATGGSKSPECLDKALADIRALGLASFDKVVSLARKRNQWRWNDPDIGPLKWLDCKDTSSPEYRHSVIALAHELSHGLAGPDCLWMADGNREVCFGIDPESVLRASVARTPIRIANPKLARTVSYFQNLYLSVHGKSNVVHILDELNAYSLSTEGLIRLLE